MKVSILNNVILLQHLVNERLFIKWRMKDLGVVILDQGFHKPVSVTHIFV